MFIPYLTGGNGDYPNVRGTFTGLTLDSDQGAMWRCVLEGIGYDYMEITGAVPTNCIVAAYAAGDVPDLKQALQRQLEVKATYVPDEGHTATYRKAYDKREALLKALNGAL